MTLRTTDYTLRVHKTNKSRIYIQCGNRPLYYFNSTGINYIESILYIDEDIHIKYIDRDIYNWNELEKKFNYLHDIKEERSNYDIELKVLLEASKYLNGGNVSFSKEFIAFFNQLLEEYLFEVKS